MVSVMETTLVRSFAATEDSSAAREAELARWGHVVESALAEVCRQEEALRQRILATAASSDEATDRERHSSEWPALLEDRKKCLLGKEVCLREERCAPETRGHIGWQRGEAGGA